MMLVHDDYNMKPNSIVVYVVLLKRSVEWQQFVRTTVEKIPLIYQEIENGAKFKANDIIAAIQDQVLVRIN